MYNMSAKLDTFYSSHVVLSQTEQTKLHDKKDLNIQRLKDGLKEYNEEHGTDYKLVETCVQGSVAMYTVVQNDDNDYDIDVAVVFDKAVLADKGAQATRNLVADALKRKTKAFNTEPEVKTSCVRIQYADGYHVDFAVYRRYIPDGEIDFKYEHAGSDWSERDLKGLTEWFNRQNDDSDGKLRRVVRLSKTFCKSRDSWTNMPSGLIQTVLCDEKLQSSYDRIDELFYYTMQEIATRLESNTDVAAPVDNERALVTRQSDRDKMINWKNRLKSKLDDLAVLFQTDCSKDDATQAWYGFFNHSYWNTAHASNYLLNSIQKVEGSYTDTEQFIESMYPVRLIHSVNVSCDVSGDGFRPMAITSFLSNFFMPFRGYLPHHFKVQCSVVSTTVPAPYSVLWKVKNVGPEAERRNDIRGQIYDRGLSITENTLFHGNHYIECYIIKDGVCVARKRIEVPISR